MQSQPDREAPRLPGRAGALGLRARIECDGFAGETGEAAYRAYMRHLRQRAPADLAAIGGRAAHAALIEQHGEDGYRAIQRSRYAAACAKHGEEVMQQRVRKAHAERRRWRIANPTPAEARLREVLIALGFSIHQISDEGFQYERWQANADPVFAPADVVLEAQVGRFFVDALIPARAVAIEAEGGVHKLRTAYDADRRRYLERTGLTVLIFDNATVLAPRSRRRWPRHSIADLLVSALTRTASIAPGERRRVEKNRMDTRNDPRPGDVVVSFGMGWESARLWQLIRDDCQAVLGVPLERVTFIVAQTGNEFPDTKYLCETHILPEMRKRGVRLVQVARKGEFEGDGIVVLDDTRSPREMHTSGAFGLYDEMLGNGTVPQFGGRGHACAQKYKGWVIGKWIDAWRGDMPYISIIGYNADETKRVAKAGQYDTHAMQQRFPLVERGEGRAEVEAHIRLEWGEWAKSCCQICPFTSGRSTLIDRHRTYPEGGARAMFLEFVSMALNHRMTLYSGGKSLYETIQATIAKDYAERDGSELDAAIAGFQHMLNTHSWAVYRVRRVYHPEVIRTDRCLKTIWTGSRAEMIERLSLLGQVEELDGHHRVYVRRREGMTRPATEEFFVAAPAVARNKAKKQFPTTWARATWDDPRPDPLEQFRLRLPAIAPVRGRYEPITML